MLIIDILLSIPFLVKSYNIHMELILKSLAVLCIGIVSISVLDFISKIISQRHNLSLSNLTESSRLELGQMILF